MDLDTFLKRKPKWPNNAYVDESGFIELYVRDTERLIPCEDHDPTDPDSAEDERVRVLDIARVEVMEKGKGTFTNLVNRLKGKCNIYVECVTTGRFEKLLARLGFTKVDNNEGFPSYYMEKQCKTE